MARSGHGVTTTAATSSPTARAASIVMRVWLIVPRPGGAAITSGKRELPGEVTHQIAEGQRDEQAADALGDEEVVAGRGGVRRLDQAGGLDPLPGQLRPEVR